MGHGIPARQNTLNPLPYGFVELRMREDVRLFFTDRIENFVRTAWLLTGHIRATYPIVGNETLAWFDRYLGPVK